MQDLNDKNTGDSFLATEWNQSPKEVQNVITSSGQTLSGADVFQLLKAVVHYASNGMFYADTGIADAYVLNPIGTNIVAPVYHNGREVEFVAANTNTGTSTLNVNTVGVKTINGSSAPGAITAGVTIRLRYDINTDAFNILSTSDISSGVFADDYLASIDSGIIGRDFTATTETILNFGTPGTSVGGFSVLTQATGSISVFGVAVNQNSGEVWMNSRTGQAVYRAPRNSDSFVETTDAFGVSNGIGITVDSSNDDVYAMDTFNNRVSKLPGGVGTWGIPGNTYKGNTPLYIAVNEATKDIWTVDGDIFDVGSGPGILFLAGGTGDWAEVAFPGTTPVAIGINQRTLDVWVVDITTSLVYKLENGLTSNAFTNTGVGSYPGSSPIGMAVNSVTGEIWIEDTADGLYYSPDGTENWVVVSDHGIDINYLAVDDNTGKVYGTVSVGTANVLYEADGENLEWFIKN